MVDEKLREEYGDAEADLLVKFQSKYEADAAVESVRAEVQ